jgi:hypothetical protein
MFVALVWISVVSLLALWSLTAWALHAAAVWALSSAGTLGGVTASGGGLSWPAWLAPWVPSELTQALDALLAGLVPALQSALSAAPALAGGITVATWLVWALGAVLLVVLGIAAHGAVALWRRRDGGDAVPPSGQSFTAG